MKKSLVAGLVAVIGTCAVLSAPASAITCPEDTPGAGRTDVGSLAECMLEPGNKPDDVFPVVQVILNTILAILGVVAVAVIILGGFYFLTSQGDAAKVTKGKNTILYGVVGLVVAFLAFAIVNFVLTNFIGKANGEDQESRDQQSSQESGK